MQCQAQQGADDTDVLGRHYGHSWSTVLYSNASLLLFYPEVEVCAVSAIALDDGSFAFPPNWTDAFSFRDRRYVNGIKASVYEHSYFLSDGSEMASSSSMAYDVELYAQYALNKGVPVHWDVGFFNDNATLGSSSVAVPIAAGAIKDLYSRKAMPAHWKSVDTRDNEGDAHELSRGPLSPLYSADIVTFTANQSPPESRFAWPAYCVEIRHIEPAPAHLRMLQLSQLLSGGVHLQLQASEFFSPSSAAGAK